MISTDERSPSGGDDIIHIHSNTRRLSTLHHPHHHNNNNGENSLYYDFSPSSPDSEGSRRVPVIHSGGSSRNSSPPSSPIVHHRQINPSHNSHSQIVLRDPPSQLDLGRRALTTGGSNLSRSTSTGGLADFIQHHLSSRLLPKLGSIVKRFSLNYSGEGLVTDRQRTRTVRVGIRFQVQVDSFVNNRLEQDHRPRAILRTQSAPAVEQLDSGFSSPTEIFPQNNRQLAALEYQTDKSSNTDRYGSSVSVPEYYCGDAEGPASSSTSSSSSSLTVGNGGIIIGGDSCSSGVSSEASSPVLNRRERDTSSTSTTLAFHNRINQALHSYRRTQLGSSPPSNTGSGDNGPFFGGRRSSVQVFRRGSATPPGSVSNAEQDQPHSSASRMEDSSSYQVLRHFPGSNVNSLSELNWETAAFEKEIRERIQWIGDKVSSLRLPRVISQLMDFGREYARENPVTAFILLALCLTSSAPVLMFLVFAVATILVTFLGFLFVEGTLLTVATVIFGGVVLVVGFLTLTAVLIGMLGYFTTNQAYQVLTGRSRIFRLLRKLPIIGRLFPEPPTTTTQESRRSSGMSEEEEHISKLLNGMASNGKVPNGHAAPYRNLNEQDDFDDLLDSEVEDDEETPVPEASSSDSEPGLDNGLLDDEEEDLGNQEVVSGIHKVDNKANVANGVSESPSSESPVVEEETESSPASPSSPVYINGHHEVNGDEFNNGELDSENSE